MLSLTPKYRSNLIFRTVHGVVLAAFFALTVLPSPAMAQAVFQLPAPGTMVPLSPAFVPATIKGIKLHPDNPLRFDFIIDTGDSNLKDKALQEETSKLIKYFLASLTVPEDDLWVNLSPFEKDRIIPNEFGTTEMGRDLLAQDYLLKQITSSLLYPDSKLGKKFWDRVYAKAKEKYGTIDIPVNTFNKVWVVPDKARIYKQDNAAFVVESHLKVMLEEDYLAISHQPAAISPLKAESRELKADTNEFSSQILRDLIIPEIEHEVNFGKNFAQLRQVYHSLILATWFKRNLKESLLSKVYVGRNKVAGVDIEDKDAKQKIYDAYLEAYKKGVYNFIKEEYDPAAEEDIPRKYFSGGVHFAKETGKALVQDGTWREAQGNFKSPAMMATADFVPPKSAVGQDRAMLASVEQNSRWLNRIYNRIQAGAKVQRPLVPNELDLVKAEQWVEAHAASDTDQFRKMARFVLNHIEYISQPEFESALSKTVKAFNEAIGDKPYVVIIPKRDKSNDWVLALAFEMGLKKPMALLTQSQIIQWFKQHPDVNQAAIIDDASYTAAQITTLWERDRIADRKLDVHIVIPFMTTASKGNIEWARQHDEKPWFLDDVHFYDTQRIKTFLEILKNAGLFKPFSSLGIPGDEFFTHYRPVVQGGDNHDAGQTLTFFAHKEPDSQSVLRIRNGKSVFQGVVIGPGKTVRNFKSILKLAPPPYDKNYAKWIRKNHPELRRELVSQTSFVGSAPSRAMMATADFVSSRRAMSSSQKTMLSTIVLAFGLVGTTALISSAHDDPLPESLNTPRLLAEPGVDPAVVSSTMLVGDNVPVATAEAPERTQMPLIKTIANTPLVDVSVLPALQERMMRYYYDTTKPQESRDRVYTNIFMIRDAQRFWEKIQRGEVRTYYQYNGDIEFLMRLEERYLVSPGEPRILVAQFSSSSRAMMVEPDPRREKFQQESQAYEAANSALNSRNAPTAQGLYAHGTNAFTLMQSFRTNGQLIPQGVQADMGIAATTGETSQRQESYLNDFVPLVDMTTATSDFKDVSEYATRSATSMLITPQNVNRLLRAEKRAHSRYMRQLFGWRWARDPRNAEMPIHQMYVAMVKKLQKARQWFKTLTRDEKAEFLELSSIPVVMLGDGAGREKEVAGIYNEAPRERLNIRLVAVAREHREKVKALLTRFGWDKEIYPVAMETLDQYAGGDMVKFLNDLRPSNAAMLGELANKLFGRSQATADITIRPPTEDGADFEIFSGKQKVGRLSYRIESYMIKFDDLSLDEPYKDKGIEEAVIFWVLKKSYVLMGERPFTFLCQAVSEPKLVDIFVENDWLDEQDIYGTWNKEYRRILPEEWRNRDRSQPIEFLSLNIRGQLKPNAQVPKLTVQEIDRDGISVPSRADMEFAQRNTMFLLDFLGMNYPVAKEKITANALRNFRVVSPKAAKKVRDGKTIGHYNRQWKQIGVNDKLSKKKPQHKIVQDGELSTEFGSTFAHEVIHFLQDIYGVGFSQWDNRIKAETIAYAVGLYLLSLGQGNNAATVLRALQKNGEEPSFASHAFSEGYKNGTLSIINDDTIKRLTQGSLNDEKGQVAAGYLIAGVAFAQYVKTGSWEVGRDVIRNFIRPARNAAMMSDEFAAKISGLADALVGKSVLTDVQIGFVRDIPKLMQDIREGEKLESNLEQLKTTLLSFLVRYQQLPNSELKEIIDSSVAHLLDLLEDLDEKISHMIGSWYLVQAERILGKTYVVLKEIRRTLLTFKTSDFRTSIDAIEAYMQSKKDPELTPEAGFVKNYENTSELSTALDILKRQYPLGQGVEILVDDTYSSLGSGSAGFTKDQTTRRYTLHVTGNSLRIRQYFLLHEYLRIYAEEMGFRYKPDTDNPQVAAYVKGLTDLFLHYIIEREIAQKFSERFKDIPQYFGNSFVSVILETSFGEDNEAQALLAALDARSKIHAYPELHAEVGHAVFQEMEFPWLDSLDQLLGSLSLESFSSDVQGAFQKMHQILTDETEISSFSVERFEERAKTILEQMRSLSRFEPAWEQRQAVLLNQVYDLSEQVFILAHTLAVLKDGRNLIVLSADKASKAPMLQEVLDSKARNENYFRDAKITFGLEGDFKGYGFIQPFGTENNLKSLLGVRNKIKQLQALKLKLEQQVRDLDPGESVPPSRAMMGDGLGLDSIDPQIIEIVLAHPVLVTLVGAGLVGAFAARQQRRSDAKFAWMIKYDIGWFFDDNGKQHLTLESQSYVRFIKENRDKSIPRLRKLVRKALEGDGDYASAAPALNVLLVLEAKDPETILVYDEFLTVFEDRAILGDRSYSYSKFQGRIYNLLSRRGKPRPAGTDQASGAATEQNRAMLSQQIKNIEPKLKKPGLYPPITNENEIQEKVDAPLQDAVRILWKKGIEVVGTSANKEDARGDDRIAYIFINYSGLSRDNKIIAAYHIIDRYKTPAGYFVAKIAVRVVPTDTGEYIRGRFVEYAKLFKSQTVVADQTPLRKTSVNRAMLSQPISEIQPKFEGPGVHPPIKMEANIKQYVDEPLEDAVRLLFTKGIKVLTSSASELVLRDSDKKAFIVIDYDNLSPVNQRIISGQKIQKISKGPQYTARIAITVSPTETGAQIRQRFLRIVKLFESQRPAQVPQSSASRTDRKNQAMMVDISDLNFLMERVRGKEVPTPAIPNGTTAENLFLEGKELFRQGRLAEAIVRLSDSLGQADIQPNIRPRVEYLRDMGQIMLADEAESPDDQPDYVSYAIEPIARDVIDFFLTGYRISPPQSAADIVVRSFDSESPMQMSVSEFQRVQAFLLAALNEYDTLQATGSLVPDGFKSVTPDKVKEFFNYILRRSGPEVPSEIIRLARQGLGLIPEVTPFLTAASAQFQANAARLAQVMRSLVQQVATATNATAKRDLVSLLRVNRSYPQTFQIDDERREVALSLEAVDLAIDQIITDTESITVDQRLVFLSLLLSSLRLNAPATEQFTEFLRAQFLAGIMQKQAEVLKKKPREFLAEVGRYSSMVLRIDLSPHIVQVMSQLPPDRAMMSALPTSGILQLNYDLKQNQGMRKFWTDQNLSKIFVKGSKKQKIDSKKREMLRNILHRASEHNHTTPQWVKVTIELLSFYKLIDLDSRKAADIAFRKNLIEILQTAVPTEQRVQDHEIKSMKRDPSVAIQRALREIDNKEFKKDMRAIIYRKTFQEQTAEEWVANTLQIITATVLVREKVWKTYKAELANFTFELNALVTQNRAMLAPSDFEGEFLLSSSAPAAEQGLGAGRNLKIVPKDQGPKYQGPTLSMDISGRTVRVEAKTRWEGELNDWWDFSYDGKRILVQDNVTTFYDGIKQMDTMAKGIALLQRLGVVPHLINFGEVTTKANGERRPYFQTDPSLIASAVSLNDMSVLTEGQKQAVLKVMDALVDAGASVLLMNRQLRVTGIKIIPGTDNVVLDDKMLIGSVETYGIETPQQQMDNILYEFTLAWDSEYGTAEAAKRLFITKYNFIREHFMRRASDQGNLAMLSQQIKDIERKFQGIGLHPPIKTKADIQKYVDDPLVKIVRALWDMGFEVISSSANKNDLRGDEQKAHIAINFTVLPEDIQQAIHRRQIPIVQLKDQRTPKGMRIHMALIAVGVTATDTEREIIKKFQPYIVFLKSQVLDPSLVSSRRQRAPSRAMMGDIVGELNAPKDRAMLGTVRDVLLTLGMIVNGSTGNYDQPDLNLHLLVPSLQQGQDPATTQQTDPIQQKARKALQLYLKDATEGKVRIPNNTDMNFWRKMLGDNKTTLSYAPDLLNSDDVLERFIEMFFESFDEAKEITKNEYVNDPKNLDVMKARIDDKEWKSKTWRNEKPETRKMSLFFKTALRKFIVAVEEQTDDLPQARSQLIEAAKAFDPKMADMMSEITKVSTDLSDLEKIKTLITKWKNFNEAFLIPAGFYGTLNVLTENSGKPTEKSYYSVVIFKVDRTETRKIQGDHEITIIYGAEIDVNTISTRLGHSLPGERRIFINSRATASDFQEIKKVLAGEHYPLVPGSKAFSSMVDQLVRSMYAGKTDAEIVRMLELSTLPHEVTHKAQELNEISCALTDQFGLSDELWKRMTLDFRESVAKEAAAYLGEMITSDKPAEVLLHLMPHFLTGRVSSEHFVARYLYNTLDGRKKEDWVTWQDANAIIGLLLKLSRDPKLQERAKALYEKAYPGLNVVDRAMMAGDYQRTQFRDHMMGYFWKLLKNNPEGFHYLANFILAVMADDAQHLRFDREIALVGVMATIKIEGHGFYSLFDSLEVEPGRMERLIDEVVLDDINERKRFNKWAGILRQFYTESLNSLPDVPQNKQFSFSHDELTSSKEAVGIYWDRGGVNLRLQPVDGTSQWKLDNLMVGGFVAGFKPRQGELQSELILDDGEEVSFYSEREGYYVLSIGRKNFALDIIGEKPPDSILVFVEMSGTAFVPATKPDWTARVEKGSLIVDGHDSGPSETFVRKAKVVPANRIKLDPGASITLNLSQPIRVDLADVPLWVEGIIDGSVMAQDMRDNKMPVTEEGLLLGALQLNAFGINQTDTNAVSGRHATIREQGNNVVIRDENSRHGTYVWVPEGAVVTNAAMMGGVDGQLTANRAMNTLVAGEQAVNLKKMKRIQAEEILVSWGEEPEETSFHVQPVTTAEGSHLEFSQFKIDGEFYQVDLGRLDEDLSGSNSRIRLPARGTFEIRASKLAKNYFFIGGGNMYTLKGTGKKKFMVLTNETLPADAALLRSVRLEDGNVFVTTDSANTKRKTIAKAISKIKPLSGPVTLGSKSKIKETYFQVTDTDSAAINLADLQFFILEKVGEEYVLRLRDHAAHRTVVEEAKDEKGAEGINDIILGRSHKDVRFEIDPATLDQFSSVHLLVRHLGDGIFYLQDANSANGTMVSPIKTAPNLAMMGEKFSMTPEDLKIFQRWLTFVDNAELSRLSSLDRDHLKGYLAIYRFDPLPPNSDRDYLIQFNNDAVHVIAAEKILRALDEHRGYEDSAHDRFGVLPYLESEVGYLIAMPLSIFASSSIRERIRQVSQQKRNKENYRITKALHMLQENLGMVDSDSSLAGIRWGDFMAGPYGHLTWQHNKLRKSDDALPQGIKFFPSSGEIGNAGLYAVPLTALDTSSFEAPRQILDEEFRDIMGGMEGSFSRDDGVRELTSAEVRRFVDLLQREIRILKNVPESHYDPARRIKFPTRSPLADSLHLIQAVYHPKTGERLDGRPRFNRAMMGEQEFTDVMRSLYQQTGKKLPDRDDWYGYLTQGEELTPEDFLKIRDIDFLERAQDAVDNFYTSLKQGSESLAPDAAVLLEVVLLPSLLELRNSLRKRILLKLMMPFFPDKAEPSLEAIFYMDTTYSSYEELQRLARHMKRMLSDKDKEHPAMKRTYFGIVQHMVNISIGNLRKWDGQTEALPAQERIHFDRAIESITEMLTLESGDYKRGRFADTKKHLEERRRFLFPDDDFGQQGEGKGNAAMMTGFAFGLPLELHRIEFELLTIGIKKEIEKIGYQDSDAAAATQQWQKLLEEFPAIWKPGFRLAELKVDAEKPALVVDYEAVFQYMMARELLKSQRLSTLFRRDNGVRLKKELSTLLSMMEQYYGLLLLFQPYVTRKTISAEQASFLARGIMNLENDFDFATEITSAQFDYKFIEQLESIATEFRVFGQGVPSFAPEQTEAIQQVTNNALKLDSSKLYEVINRLNTLYRLYPVGKGNAAMMGDVTKPNVKPNEVGGIDLNPAKLDIEDEGQDIQINVPALDMKMFEGADFKGLTPFIIQIVPVTNLPLLLGAKEPVEEEKLSMR